MIEATNGIFGHDKTVVTFDGRTISIDRGSFLGHREERIPVSKVTMTGWRKSTMRKLGYIEFITAGANRKVSGKVSFTDKPLAEFERLRDAVEAALGA